MKVIDLLNVWVKDRNKLPEKIKIDNIIFEYNKELNFYKESNKDYFLIQDFLVCEGALHRKVEVIEENKDIEEILNEELTKDEELEKEVNHRKEYERLKEVEKENQELKETIINMSKYMFKRDNDLSETIRIIAKELRRK